MLDPLKVEQEEERLRGIISSLLNDERKRYYETMRNRIRDPDTYAVLNWFLLASH